MATSKPAISAIMSPIASKVHSGIRIPKLIYGTAWKKDRTSLLVYQALKAGFRGIDTAAQPRHYNEAQVGEGIKKAINEGIIKREDLYLQTKVTSPAGQDLNNMPYSASDPLTTQISTSLASSLKNFTFSPNQEPYIDCLVLHSPLPTLSETLAAWSHLSTFVPSTIHSLGISNTDLPTLRAIYNSSEIKPSVVQNRFYPSTGWDVELREFCRERGIVYECFWTLTGNPGLVKSVVVQEVARKLEGKGIGGGDVKAIVLYGLVLGTEGMTVLDGTTREERMKGDLEGLEELGRLVEGEWKEKWEGWLGEFRQLIGEV